MTDYGSKQPYIEKGIVVRNGRRSGTFERMQANGGDGQAARRHRPIPLPSPHVDPVVERELGSEPAAAIDADA